MGGSSLPFRHGKMGGKSAIRTQAEPFPEYLPRLPPILQAESPRLKRPCTNGRLDPVVPRCSHGRLDAVVPNSGGELPSVLPIETFDIPGGEEAEFFALRVPIANSLLQGELGVPPYLEKTFARDHQPIAIFLSSASEARGNHLFHKTQLISPAFS